MIKELTRDRGNEIRLRPRIHPQISDFLTEEKLIISLVNAVGSPLNLIFPENIDENISSFQDVYKKNHLRGTIYFSSKPCKSRSIMRHASLHDIGIDVSSEGSLTKAMAAGFKPGRIEVTGPKNLEYLLLSIQLGVLVNVDNIEELKCIPVLVQRAGVTKARIAIRMADYESSRIEFLKPDDTNFGILVKDIPWVFDYLKNNRDTIDFNGFSYHSSMASDDQRIAAMESQMSLTFAAIDKGLSPSVVNIGGGFPIMYADSCKQWVDYVAGLKESVVGKRSSETWNGNGLGFRSEGGILRGVASFIDHAPNCTKGEELERWLNFRLPSHGNVSFGQLVRDSLFELAIEPGRGMLDQCGITLAKVNFIKESTHGETLVGLDMNRSNLHANGYKQLTEPIVITRGKDNPVCQNGVYYMGNLCLAHDMLRYNKTYPDRLPQAGDIVAFINTAAYMMDFTESESLMQPIAKKIALSRNRGEWSWTLDENYAPLKGYFA